MNSINAVIERALNYSQTMDFIFASIAAALLYFCRLKHKIIYGFIEIIIGLYLASFAFNVTRSFSEEFDADDFDVVHLNVVITTYLGAIFVMVRGFDNIHSGWKAKPDV